MQNTIFDYEAENADNKMDAKIYVAGPLFTDAERHFNEKLAEILREKGYDVFLPQELSIDFDSKTWQQDTFHTNVKHIDESDIVIAVLDGPICDDGTSWEVGYAWAKNKPIIGFRTDFRTAGPEGVINLMLGYSVHKLCDDYEKLFQELELIQKIKDSLLQISEKRDINV